MAFNVIDPLHSVSNTADHAPAIRADRREWSRAFDALRTARADRDAFGQLHDRHSAAGTLTTAICARMNRLDGALSEAEQRVLDVPAPSAVEARWKLDFIVEPEDGCLSGWPMESVRQTLADVRRFLGAGTGEVRA